MASKKAKGKRSKTRSSFTKRGPVATVNKLLQEIPTGAKVDIAIDPSIHSGLPDKRYQGKTGTVTGKQGAAFVVAVSKGNKDMVIIVGPAHLRVSKGAKKKAEAKVEVEAAA